jgi:Leucine-rich repeat (LRR) protein
MLFITLITKINKRSLKYLKLSDNKITDIGFGNLLKHISSASNVNMSGNMLT